MSGITATDNCVEQFNAFKMQNSKKGAVKRAYIVFRIKDESIVIAEEGAEDATWGDFVSTLAGNKKDGAYGIFDMKVKTDDGRELAKIVFVSWTPDSGLPIKMKMLYGSSREAFKSQLGSGISYTIQATDIADLDEDDVTNMVKKGR